MPKHEDERIADERHLEPDDPDDGDQAGQAHADDEKRHGLAEDELGRPDRADHDLLERADLALAHHGERREIDHHAPA